MKATLLVVGGGILLAGGYFFKLYKDSERLEVEQKARIHSVKGEGLKIGLAVSVKNPTGTDFRIRRPFLKLNYQGRVIGSSAPQRDFIEIKAGETSSMDILVDVPWSSLGFLGLQVLQKLRGEGFEISLEAVIETAVRIGMFDLPIRWIEPIVMKR